MNKKVMSIITVATLVGNVIIKNEIRRVLALMVSFIILIFLSVSILTIAFIGKTFGQDLGGAGAGYSKSSGAEYDSFNTKSLMSAPAGVTRSNSDGGDAQVADKSVTYDGINGIKYTMPSECQVESVMSYINEIKDGKVTRADVSIEIRQRGMSLPIKLTCVRTTEVWIGNQRVHTVIDEFPLIRKER